MYFIIHTLFTIFRNNTQMHVHFRKVNFLSCVRCLIRVTHSIFNEHLSHQSYGSRENLREICGRPLTQPAPT